MFAEPAMGALSGGILGGALGGLGQVLSAPRRGLWSALGLPEHGNELLAQTFGMDPEAWYTHALGFGAEAALDPLTYAGMLAGGPLTKLLNKGMVAAPVAPAIGQDLAAWTAARRAAQQGMVNRAGVEADIAAIEMARGPGLKTLDIPGIAGGQAVQPMYAHAPALEELRNAGLADMSGMNFPQARPVPGKPGEFLPLPIAPDDTVLGGLVHGRTYPPGFEQGPLRNAANTAQMGRQLRRIPGTTNELPRLYGPEIYDLAEIAGRQSPAGWAGLESIHHPGLGPAGVVDEMLNANTQRMIRNLPKQTLGDVLPGRLPSGWEDVLASQTGGTGGGWGNIGSALDLPLPQAFAMSQKGVAAALARQQAKQAAYQAARSAYGAATELTNPDVYKLAGAAGLGGYAGGMMGNEMMGSR